MNTDEMTQRIAELEAQVAELLEAHERDRDCIRAARGILALAAES